MKQEMPDLVLDSLTRTLPPRGRVMRWVSAAIGSGKLRIGQPLPSERMLAEQLGVSRTAVRAALNEMAADGSIDQPNGGRLRRVARAIDPASAQAGPSMMSDTLAILSTVGLPQGTVGSGLEETYIKHQAAVTIESSGLHAMVISPGRLVDRGLERFLNYPPAGILVVDEVAPNTPAHQVLTACGTLVPTVVHGGVPDLERYDRVVSDHYSGGKAMAQWLIQQGRRRILRVWLTAAEFSWLEQRSHGISDALQEAGLAVSPALRIPAERLAAAMMNGPRDAQQRIWDDQIRRIAGYLIEWFGGLRPPEERPDAIMCTTDGHAIQVSAALRVFGLRPGRDVLVTGYDNNWQMVPYLRFESARPAATVEKNNDRCAETMVQLLRDRIAGQLPPERQCRSIEHELRPMTDSVHRA